VTLSRVAVALAVLAACAPAPRPAPLQNQAAANAPRAALPPACPPREPDLVKLSSGAVGAIAGIVVDERCELLAGATIIVRPAAQPLRGAGQPIHAEITDERGRFTVIDLSPGQYLVAVYYLDTTLERGGVLIRAGAVEHMQLAMPPPVKAEPRITRVVIGAEVLAGGALRHARSCSARANPPEPLRRGASSRPARCGPAADRARPT
jgi:hypothetical protein